MSKMRWPKQKIGYEFAQAEPAAEQTSPVLDGRPEKILEWWVTGYDQIYGVEAILYHGHDRAVAREIWIAARANKALRNVTVHGGGWVYPPPSVARFCQCKNQPEKARCCPTGHETECHYPVSCSVAGCLWLEFHEHGDPDGLAEKIKVLETDKPYAGDYLGNECSRCGNRSHEPMVVVECHDDSVYRYCAECMR